MSITQTIHNNYTNTLVYMYVLEYNIITTLQLSVVEDATIIGFAGWLGKGWITSSCLLHVYSAMEEGTQWNSLLVVKQLKAPTP